MRRPLFKASLLLGAGLTVRHLIRRRRKLDLAGRVVLITGGSRGLGLALAREFARRRAEVALCARDAEELHDAAEDIRGRYPVPVHTFTCDLRDRGDIARLIRNVEMTCGDIDVLVNNAGTISVGPLETMTDADFREAMDVNFWSAVHTTMTVLPGMKARREGRIVNIGSIGGKVPVPHMAAYCASKFALVGFSSALRTELARDGILVTTVNPGLMRTGSPRNAKFKGQHRAEYAWFSISDSLPGLSMGANRAARRIVDATVYGESEALLGLPALLASKLHGLAPALSLEMTALANWLLPGAGGAMYGVHRGQDSESWITRSIFRKLGHKAEREFNQF